MTQTQTQKTNGSHGHTAYIPYTTRQAAQVLGITITGVNDMIRRGVLTATHFGTAGRAHHFLNPADVHALAARRAQIKAARDQEKAEKALRKAARTRTFTTSEASLYHDAIKTPTDRVDPVLGALLAIQETQRQMLDTLRKLV